MESASSIKTLRFKTNINCGGCIATVKPHLDKLVGEGQWEVNIAIPEKILTVNTSSEAAAIIEGVSAAGFKIEAA